MQIQSAPIQVTADNFVRAETDLYIKALSSKPNGFGNFNHTRLPSPLDEQSVIRLNRDTLYSAGVFDLKAGPVTITLPDAGKRFMSMQVINQDHYTPMVNYKPGSYVLSEENVGTRYVTVAIRTFVDPTSEKDLTTAQKLQDKIKVSQPGGPGKLELPEWDQASQKTVRDALLILNNSLPDTNFMFGTKDEVKPVRYLIGAASAWGGNPQRDATYLNVYPTKNDGKTIYTLTVPKDVPVNGFWSISVYNKDGFFQKNEFNSYTLNNITAKTDKDGSYKIQFGGCTKGLVNCIPTSDGWNYMVRLYQPQESILNGSWKFPVAQPK
ncbi:DUF1214 domain-containing protein [Acinetobacter junii]|uniref:DUF1214 domain-containing protein n=1 Tax=Acinetobacter junii TaxID=40215 RepID=UPI001F3FA9F3|nr:DUF1254 domain-containing protein [Acinetobacter junii]